MAPRKRATSRGKPEQIRRAAYRCFRDGGYHETSVDAICREAAISKGSFYWHYTSKQEVFIDILETWTREIMDELYAQFEDALHEQDYISAITTALVKETRRGRVMVPLWLEFTVLSRREPEIQEALSKFYRRARTAIGEMLWPVLGDRVSGAELRGVTTAIFGAYAGLLMQEMSDPERADSREAVRQLMSVLGWWIQTRQGDADDRPRGPVTPPPPPERVIAAAVAEAPVDRAVESPPEESPPAKAPRGSRATEAERDALLADAGDASRAQVEALRALLDRVAPEADERVIHGWGALGWDQRGLICGIEAREGGARLLFYRGAGLQDPAGLLRGRGKRRRSVEVTAGDALPEGLEGLVRTAFGG